MSEDSSDPSRRLRIGHGYDTHRLVMDRPLVLAGLTIPSDLGLEGHSDGDAVCHALIDALLGAAAMGDIGTHFPSEDPALEGASSLGLLESVVAKLDGAGFHVQNADVTVVLEVPRLGPYRDDMVANLARVLGVDPGLIGLKATTNQRLGPVGAGEAIAAMAMVLIRQDAA